MWQVESLVVVGVEMKDTLFVFTPLTYFEKHRMVYNNYFQEIPSAGHSDVEVWVVLI